MTPSSVPPGAAAVESGPAQVASTAWVEATAEPAAASTARGSVPSAGPAESSDTAAEEGFIDVAGYATSLADGIDEALPSWVQRSVARIMTAWIGTVPPEVAEEALRAGHQAAADVAPRVRALLLADIDEQRSTPLAILRGAAVRYPTEVLATAGVPPVVRDRAAEELFPADVYDLVPASFADLDPALADAGLYWGAAKAFEHKRRHRPQTSGGKR
jgi:hypothetical protein